MRWLGAPLALGGAALFGATLRTLGPNLTDTVVTRKAHTLVTAGPYRWVRHPFYLSALLGGLGTALLSASLLILCATLLVYALLVLRTPIEERHLAERFGEPYEEYRRQVPAFWPRRPPFGLSRERGLAFPAGLAGGGARRLRAPRRVPGGSGGRPPAVGRWNPRRPSELEVPHSRGTEGGTRP